MIFALQFILNEWHTLCSSGLKSAYLICTEQQRPTTPGRWHWGAAVPNHVPKYPYWVRWLIFGWRRSIPFHRRIQAAFASSIDQNLFRPNLSPPTPKWSLQGGVQMMWLVACNAHSNVKLICCSPDSKRTWPQAVTMWASMQQTFKPSLLP